jgi:hypothetical protein
LTRVAGTAVVALVERQEHGGRAVESGDHVHLGVAHREVDQRPVGEGEQRLGSLALGVREAVEAVLVDGVVDALREVGLELDGSDRQAVEEEDHVDAVLVVQRVADLADDAEAVGLVAREDVGVDPQGGLELGELDRLP